MQRTMQELMSVAQGSTILKENDTVHVKNQTVNDMYNPYTDNPYQRPSNIDNTHNNLDDEEYDDDRFDPNSGFQF